MECTKETSHIDDLVDAVIKIHENPKKNDLYDHTAEDPSRSAPYRI